MSLMALLCCWPMQRGDRRWATMRRGAMCIRLVFRCRCRLNDVAVNANAPRVSELGHGEPARLHCQYTILNRYDRRHSRDWSKAMRKMHLSSTHLHR